MYDRPPSFGETSPAAGLQPYSFERMKWQQLARLSFIGMHPPFVSPPLPKAQEEMGVKGMGPAQGAQADQIRRSLSPAPPQTGASDIFRHRA